MDLEQLRAELVGQERFSPDLDAVRDRVRQGIQPTSRRSGHRIVVHRRLAIAASVAVVAILAGVIAVVHAHSQPTRLASPPVSGVGGIRWQLTSATVSGKNIALPPDKATTMELDADGTSTMEGPACFYRTGRWHQVNGGIELTDQVSVVMSCYAITDLREGAGGSVLTGLAGTLTLTVTQHTLTLRNADAVANFSDA